MKKTLKCTSNRQKQAFEVRSVYLFLFPGS